ncbi:MAG: TIGR03905 family TSCPD domain-containing protein [Oscillospiraceae bacterium]|nr:TIGR03905 family TSCPD domain-containing protein [Oscillospiraceae bacterium]
MTYTYRPKGVCSQQIIIDLNGDVIENLRVLGGCAGNLQGISALVRGMKAQEAIERLRGIRCGFKTTSCPDQIAKALEEALEG